MQLICSLQGKQAWQAWASFPVVLYKDLPFSTMVTDLSFLHNCMNHYSLQYKYNSVYVVNTRLNPIYSQIARIIFIL